VRRHKLLSTDRARKDKEQRQMRADTHAVLSAFGTVGRADYPSNVQLEGSADWLANLREDHEWLILDTKRRNKKPRLVSFRYPLPDGSLLTDQKNADLYQTVKEFGVLVREGPYAISDHLAPEVHVSLLRSLMYIVGWMRLNCIDAFSALTPNDVERLSEEIVYGFATLLRAPERLRSALLRLADDGLLHTVLRGRYKRRIRRDLMFAYAAIPYSLATDPQLSAILRSVETSLENNCSVQEAVNLLNEEFDPAEKLLTNQTIQRYLSPLDFLWVVRRPVLGSNIQFDPFPDGLANLTRNVGKEVQRTPTVPPRQAMELVDRSIRWVMDYSDPILSAYERAVSLRKIDGLDAAESVEIAVAEMTDCVPGPGAPWPLLPVLRRRGQNVTGVTLPEAVKLLVLACFIIIATFTGRRLDEILSLEFGCTRGDARYGYWIKTYIEKTLRRVDETPCPAIVVFVVEQILERLNRSASAVKAGCALSTWVAIDVNGTQALRRLNPQADLNPFARLVSVSRVGDGSLWHFTPRQFRRFFAIVYIWRYEYGDLGALAHHLRHFSLRMTQRYVTEGMAGLIMEEEKALTKAVLCEASSGERRIGGPAGTRFLRLLDRAKAAISKLVHIVLPSRLEAYVTRFMDKSRILLKSNPWSYCTCPMTVEAASRANCRLEAAVPKHGARGPDLAGAKPDTCAGCVFNLTDSRRRPVIEREISNIHNRLANAFLPLPARTAEEKRLRKLERYLEDFPQGPESI
jgi:hypothetical protein